jgi:Transposase domain (DUF772)
MSDEPEPAAARRAAARRAAKRRCRWVRGADPDYIRYHDEEQEARRNLEVIWLVGRLAPDFKTLADFRAENAAAITNVFREFIVHRGIA